MPLLAEIKIRKGTYEKVILPDPPSARDISQAVLSSDRVHAADYDGLSMVLTDRTISAMQN